MAIHLWSASNNISVLVRPFSWGERNDTRSPALRLGLRRGIDVRSRFKDFHIYNRKSWSALQTHNDRSQDVIWKPVGLPPIFEHDLTSSYIFFCGIPDCDDHFCITTSLYGKQRSPTAWWTYICFFSTEAAHLAFPKAGNETERGVHNSIQENLRAAGSRFARRKEKAKEAKANKLKAERESELRDSQVLYSWAHPQDESYLSFQTENQLE